MQFASRLGPTVVIVSTQPSEPYFCERYEAVKEACLPIPEVNRVEWHHAEIEQNPEAPGFRDLWKSILTAYGMQPGDYFVGSESYGIWVAEMMGATFVPYDPYREISSAKATLIRDDSLRHFSHVLPEFQPNLRQTVTIFGAESTGKTTLAKELAASMRGHFLMEWARPYLETCGTDITTESMTAIWHGQQALQDHAQQFFVDKPWVIQDTDLFSTVGYWDFWDMKTPRDLVAAATARKSDLYLVTKSNIPFEQDPIRYGGDQRESDDQYWIDLCDRHGLNYRVLKSVDIADRLNEAEAILMGHWYAHVVSRLAYRRAFNDTVVAV